MDDKDKKILDTKKAISWGTGKGIAIPTKQESRKSVAERVRDAQRERQVEASMNVASQRIALNLDCSGSMKGQPIQNLREATTSFIDSCDFTNTTVGIVTFGMLTEISEPLTNDPYLLKQVTNSLTADGGTPMGEALQHTLSTYSITRCVLMSDGSPTDLYYNSIQDWEEEDDYTHPIADNPLLIINDNNQEYSGLVVQNYVNADIPIDCVHCSDGDNGVEFMKEVARRTGGIFMKFTDGDAFREAFKFLAPKYRALLTSGSLQIEGAKEVIINKRSS